MSEVDKAVAAAMDALGCDRVTDGRNHYCAEHHVGWLSDVNACARAERVANAVAHAATAWIGAEALREAAQAAEDEDPRDWPFAGLDEMQRWLLRRADGVQS